MHSACVINIEILQNTSDAQFINLISSHCLFPSPPASQGNDLEVTDAGEKAESSRCSRSYTSGATLGAELRRGRTRRLSPSLQVFRVIKDTLTCLEVAGHKKHEPLSTAPDHALCHLTVT